jgi:hypothetical protein
MKDTGGPAFPVKTAMFDCTQSGMTLRDYFAAKAMQALITRRPLSGGEVAGDAYIIADAMLKARNQ